MTTSRETQYLLCVSSVIQIRSNGNPGWIESFLISLFQDEGVYILKASMRDINDLGLVAPPLYLMARLFLIIIAVDS